MTYITWRSPAGWFSGGAFSSDRAVQTTQSPARASHSGTWLRSTAAARSPSSGSAEAAANRAASVRPAGCASSNPLLERSSSTPGVASPCTAKKDALARNAIETSASRASARRRASTLTQHPSRVLIPATTRMSQKWLCGSCHITSSEGRASRSHNPTMGSATWNSHTTTRTGWTVGGRWTDPVGSATVTFSDTGATSRSAYKYADTVPPIRFHGEARRDLDLARGDQGGTMARKGPLFTLLGGGALAAVLLAASVNAAAGDDDEQQNVAGATPPTQAATTAPPPTTPPAVAEEVEPLTYVGYIDGGGASVAIVVNGTEAVAYVCNGSEIEAWFN